MNTHLITGVTGQDGVLLARLLVAQGDRVIGTTRGTNTEVAASYLAGVEVVQHDLRDLESFEALLTAHKPDSVINLAAVTSVGASWDDAGLTRSVNLEAVEGMLRVLSGDAHEGIRFVQASSSEIFGPPAESGALTDEDTDLNPVSPYAEAKASAHLAVKDSRDAGLLATNVILFGHTSPLQHTDFVLAEVAAQAAAVADGERDAISLRNPLVRRDWGAASDVAAAFAMTLNVDPDDFVIATGQLHGLIEIGRWALDSCGQSGAEVTTSGEAQRVGDFDGRVGDSRRALSRGWSPTTPLRAEIERMVQVCSTRRHGGPEHHADYLSPNPSPR